LNILVEKNIRVAMPDGVTLATEVYRPADDDQHAVLLSRTPYGKDMLLHTASARLDLMHLVQQGYVAVLQDCRGTGGSDGRFRFYFDEAPDGLATVEWCAAQPWSNHRLGMFGGSYLSTTQFTVAMHSDRVGAIAPAVAPSLYYGDLAYRGGALALISGLEWSLQRGFVEQLRQAASGAGAPDRTPDPPDAGVVARRTPLNAVPELRDGPGQHYLTWLDHPAHDDYWRSIGYADGYPRVTTPGLHIGGWYDIFLGGTIANYQNLRSRAATGRAREHQRLIIGPWSHINQTGLFPGRSYGPWAGPLAGLTVEHERHFNHWLRDAHEAEEPTTRVRIFVMGIDQWREEDDWPLPDTNYRDFYLHSSGMANTSDGTGLLSTTRPTEEPIDTYVYNPADPVPTCGGATLIAYELNEGPADQRAIEHRADVLCYTTPPLDNPQEVTGPVELIVYISADVPDTDITASLIDVHPDGRAELLTDGILRARYRTSYERAELMNPGEVYALRIDLWATSNVFLTGHRIRVDISSSNFPRYDRNSNTGGVIATERDTDMRPARVTIHHDANYPSRLVLPLIQGSR
jgi:uncharacterized protein